MRLGLGSTWADSQPSPCPCASPPRPCRPWSALSSLLPLSRLHPPVLGPRSASRHSHRGPALPAVLNPGCQGRCGATLAWAQGSSHWAVLPGPRAVPTEGLSRAFLSSSVTFIVSRSVRLSLSSLGTLIPTDATLEVGSIFLLSAPTGRQPWAPLGMFRTAQSRPEGRLPRRERPSSPIHQRLTSATA